MTKILLFLPSLQAIILLLISTIFQCDAQRLLNTVAVLELHVPVLPSDWPAFLALALKASDIDCAPGP